MRKGEFRRIERVQECESKNTTDNQPLSIQPKKLDDTSKTLLSKQSVMALIRVMKHRRMRTSPHGTR